MGVGRALGRLLQKADRQFGLLAWLRGELRPPAGGFDLRGEKALDWGWVCVNLPPSPQRGLDVGCGESPTVPAMLALGYEVTAVDLEYPLDRQLAGLNFVRGDFNKVLLEPGFDVVVACSTVEHIGLSGRYGSAEDTDGDVRAMSKIAALIKPEGVVILTVPVGKDAVFRPWHRVYGRQRIGSLLNGFQILKSQAYIKQPWGPWQATTLDAALDFAADQVRYALGQMVLRKTK